MVRPLNLTDALGLTIVIARKDARRPPRVAARCLQRYLEERTTTIDDAAMVVSCLAALTHERGADAAEALRGLARDVAQSSSNSRAAQGGQ